MIDELMMCRFGVWLSVLTLPVLHYLSRRTVFWLFCSLYYLALLIGCWALEPHSGKAEQRMSAIAFMRL